MRNSLEMHAEPRLYNGRRIWPPPFFILFISRSEGQTLNSAAIYATQGGPDNELFRTYHGCLAVKGSRRSSVLSNERSSRQVCVSCSYLI
jgi:hypothetical protein